MPIPLPEYPESNRNHNRCQQFSERNNKQFIAKIQSKMRQTLSIQVLNKVGTVIQTLIDFSITPRLLTNSRTRKKVITKLTGHQNKAKGFNIC